MHKTRKLDIFGMTQHVHSVFSEKFEHFQLLTHVKLSRSMAAILKMPQYVAYQKDVAYVLLSCA